MCPHLPFWGGTSAQDDLNSWPLPRPKLLQVVVIKIRPGAVQETILMTTRLQEGVSAAHLAEGGPARRLRAPWLLVHRSKEWFSHSSESSSMLWGTFFISVGECYWILSSWTLAPVKEKVVLLSPKAVLRWFAGLKTDLLTRQPPYPSSKGVSFCLGIFKS